MDSGLTIVSTTNNVFNLSLYDQLTEASLVRASCGCLVLGRVHACLS